MQCSCFELQEVQKQASSVQHQAGNEEAYDIHLLPLQPLLIKMVNYELLGPLCLF